MDREALAWAAGLFEGEGSVGLRNPSQGNRRGSCFAVLASTDFDVLEAFRRVVGFGAIGPQRTGPGRKPMRRWATNKFEHVQALVAMLWPWLGERRRTQAVATLQGMADRPESRRWRYWLGRPCDAEGCARTFGDEGYPRWYRGLCNAHYQRAKKGLMVR